MHPSHSHSSVLRNACREPVPRVITFFYDTLTRRVCKCQRFLRSVASAALTRDQVLHYLARQVKFYSLSFHVIDIKRFFRRNKLLNYFERCPFTEYVG